MNLKKKGLSCFLSCSIALSGSAFAVSEPSVELPFPSTSPNGFELIGALGAAAVKAGNSEIGVTSSETDRLIQTNGSTWNTHNWGNFAAQGGVGYIHYFRHARRYSKHTQWFPAIEPELNAYYLRIHNIKGDVWRFDSSSFNQLNYFMPVDSARLMFDTALTIVSKRRLSLYGIAGVGNAWNRLGYNDTDKGLSCTDQIINLNALTKSNFAWEAGAGLSFILSKRTSLTAEYLYADLGAGQPSMTGSTGTITAPIIAAPHVDLTAQTALLGLHVKL